MPRIFLPLFTVTLFIDGLEQENIKEIDINPVILAGSKPVAVDALIVLDSRRFENS